MRRNTARRSSPSSAIPDGPLPVDRATVALAGPVRAAADAVKNHPGVIASREAARLEGPAAILEHTHAASVLLRRTAEAHAKLGASFTRGETLPPF